MEDARYTLVGLGEALFDRFPGVEKLGGAPLNAAVHAHRLIHAHQGRGIVASRIGQDPMGRRLKEELTSRGMTAGYLQEDPDHDTGVVDVSLDDQGQPSYTIVQDVAWDWMQFDPDLEDLARNCHAVCFGSLAQRNGQSRNTIYRFLDQAKRAVKLFDVNLRQSFFDNRVLERSCELADLVKLNRDELDVVRAELGLSEQDPETAAQRLIKRYALKAVALTRGAEGTVLYTANGPVEGAPARYETPEGESADAVGAGDACTAGLMVGLSLRWPMQRAVDLANHTGAYVASRAGATPEMDPAILKMVEG